MHNKHYEVEQKIKILNELQTVNETIKHFEREHDMYVLLKYRNRKEALVSDLIDLLNREVTYYKNYRGKFYD